MPKMAELVSDSQPWKPKMDKNPDDPAPATEQSEVVRRQEGLRHVDQEGAREVLTDVMEQNSKINKYTNKEDADQDSNLASANSEYNDHQPPDTEIMTACEFDKLFSISVPHICESIFLSLDYTSFKKCADVCRFWNDLLASESFLKFGKPIFRGSIHKELKLAILRGQTEEVRRMLANGMVDMNYSTEEEATPLCLAAMSGRKEIVQLLLEKGADPNGAANNI